METVRVATPLGPFFFRIEGESLVESGFEDRGSDPTGALGRAVQRAVSAYFAKRAPLPAFPLALAGPPFFRRVWHRLAATRPGEVLSYRELAELVGRPRAARAVARAMAENPLPLFVPCHRVIRSDGRLGGYGPAPWRKAALLLLEAGEPHLEDRLPRLRAHPDLAAVRLRDLLGDGEP